MKKIAIAEDNLFFRDLCVKALELTGQFEVVICASNGLELIMELHTQPVDLIILDIKMPIMKGTDTIQHIKQNYKKTKVIVYSNEYSESIKQNYLEKGVDAVIGKEKGFDNLIKILEKQF
jgi:CheY-like chemotaxis protein